MKSVIAGASVIDGTGAPAQPYDVYVDDGTIVELRPHSDAHAGWSVVDATGLTLAPGFIDAHSHADFAPFLHDDDTTKILQGVTTEVVGNCGYSLAPTTEPYGGLALSAIEARLGEAGLTEGSFGDCLAAMDRRGYVTNFAPLVGHNTLRIAAFGMAAREPRPDELAHMAAMLDEALEAGAFGLSTGLIYAPGSYAQTSEIVALAKRLRPNTLYATHLRSESDGLLAAVDEALTIGRDAGARVQISHHKAAGRANWGATRESLARIGAARASGVDVFLDVYPYIAGSTSLRALLPPEFLDGGPDATLHRLRDETALATLEARLSGAGPPYENLLAAAGYEGVLIATTPSGRFEGSTLAEIARERGLEPFRALVEVLVEEQLEPTMTIFLMDEADVERVLADDHVAIGTDGAFAGAGGKPHPRLFGTFPRVLGTYVRERKILSLEAAIRKMTSLPARIFRIPSRGELRAGYVADLVAFHAATIADDLDYRDPVRLPKGIAWVMQSGRLVVTDGTYAGGRTGRRLVPAPAES